MNRGLPRTSARSALAALSQLSELSEMTELSELGAQCALPRVAEIVGICTRTGMYLGSAQLSAEPIVTDATESAHQSLIVV